MLISRAEQYSQIQVAYVLARFLMRYDAMDKHIDQDNLVKGWQTVLTPGNGVKLRMRLAPDHLGLNIMSALL